MLRLFVALTLPTDAIDALRLLEGGVPGARWVPEENLHLTLRFVGEVEPDIAEELDARLGRISAPGFWLRLTGVGSFAGGRRPTSLWAGTDRPPALQHLHEKVDRAAVAAGAKPDGRRFTPHVTVARLRATAMDQAQGWVARHGLFSVPPFPVDRFTLFQSHLTDEGSQYEPLAEYELGPPEGAAAAGWREAVAAARPWGEA